MDLNWNDVRTIVQEVLEEDFGTGRYELTPRFEKGTLIFRPKDPALKEREVPVEMFFKKITSVREKLRVLEQKINGHEKLTDADKVEMQQYITRSYGSLTTFNLLFRNKEDQFGE